MPISPLCATRFAEASDVLKQNLWQLVAEGSDADLNATVNTQPVMLTAGVAVYRAWQSQDGAMPAIMAGHSLGEYTALVAAGALDLPMLCRWCATVRNACSKPCRKAWAALPRSSAWTMKPFVPYALKARKVKCWKR